MFELAQQVLCADQMALSFLFAGLNCPLRITYDLYRMSSFTILQKESLKPWAPKKWH